MIHLKYKCEVNFVKLPLNWVYLWLKLVFENATAGREQAAARLWTARVASVELQSVVGLATRLAKQYATKVTRQLPGRVQELKNARNSVTVQNQKHVYWTFFNHKNLGNHPLKLCRKIVKHPVDKKVKTKFTIE
jgi:hypothetical protein